MKNLKLIPLLSLLLLLGSKNRYWKICFSCEIIIDFVLFRLCFALFLFCSRLQETILKCLTHLNIFTITVSSFLIIYWLSFWVNSSFGSFARFCHLNYSIGIEIIWKMRRKPKISKQIMGVLCRERGLYLELAKQSPNEWYPHMCLSVEFEKRNLYETKWSGMNIKIVSCNRKKIDGISNHSETRFFAMLLLSVGFYFNFFYLWINVPFSLN